MHKPLGFSVDTMTYKWYIFHSELSNNLYVHFMLMKSCFGIFWVWAGSVGATMYITSTLRTFTCADYEHNYYTQKSGGIQGSVWTLHETHLWAVCVQWVQRNREGWSCRTAQSTSSPKQGGC